MLFTEKAPFVPPLTMTSSAVKPVTSSEKEKVKVTSPVATESVMSSVIETVGAVVSGGWVSKSCFTCAAAMLPLPAASFATSASISTVMVPAELGEGLMTSV